MGFPTYTGAFGTFFLGGGGWKSTFHFFAVELMPNTLPKRKWFFYFNQQKRWKMLKDVETFWLKKNNRKTHPSRVMACLDKHDAPLTKITGQTCRSLVAITPANSQSRTGMLREPPPLTNLGKLVGSTRGIQIIHGPIEDSMAVQNQFQAVSYKYMLHAFQSLLSCSDCFLLPWKYGCVT